MLKINTEFRNKILKEIPEIKNCFQCGTCTSSCLVKKYTGKFSPREKILSALEGRKEVLNNELWLCSTCNACNERCPQNVNPYEIIIKLKNIAFREGLIENSEEKTEPAKNVIETGLSLKTSEFTENERKKLGLPETKKIDELKKIIKLK